jgi:hypothetical protein
MDQYRYLLCPIPLHWSAKEADAALHVLEQLQLAIRQAYAAELHETGNGQRTTDRSCKKHDVPRKPCSPKRANGSLKKRERAAID